jgi:hypothetical protein
LALAAALLGSMSFQPESGARDEYGTADVPAPGERRVGEHLRALLVQGRRDLEDLEQRTEKLSEALRRLLEQAQAAPRGAREEKAAGAPAPVKRHKFRRPPMGRYTGQPAVVFTCREGRVSFVDMTAVNQHVKKLRSTPALAGQRTVSFALPDSAASLEVVVERGPNGLTIDREVRLAFKPKECGETAEEIQQETSRFQRALARHQPGKCYVSFGVWPDSYDAFLKARDLAWKAGYEVGWIPMDLGETAKLGSGPGVIQ